MERIPKQRVIPEICDSSERKANLPQLLPESSSFFEGLAEITVIKVYLNVVSDRVAVKGSSSALRV